jgi:hypothetical protein
MTMDNENTYTRSVRSGRLFYFLDARNKFLIMLPKTGFTFVVAPHIIEVHLTVAPANKISSLLKVLQVVAE